MMATTAPAQRAPRGLEYEGTQLPFFSRYATGGSAGVDVFSQDVTYSSKLKERAFRVLFPTPRFSGGCTAIPRREKSSCGGSGTRPAKVVVPQVRGGDNTDAIDF